ncbi:hypothetical protein HDU76_013242 [Blyttiomyces sp. JEL0837]|nr:hypothetical protein HDU76_013242 [Blyttiomyces sp. JEL0837]
MHIALVFTVIAAVYTVAAQSSPQDNENGNNNKVFYRGMHYKSDYNGSEIPRKTGAVPHLNYYGGPVIPHVNVTTIFYGNPTFPTKVKEFYRMVVKSPWLAMLNEYNTKSQKIGNGIFGGHYTETGSIKSKLDDAKDIQPYLIKLAKAAGACKGGCGSSSITFNNLCSVASHELAESISDPAVGIATALGPPLAWYDPNNGEIGDICNGQHGTFLGSDGVTYTVQKLWLNSKNACVTHT